MEIRYHHHIISLTMRLDLDRWQKAKIILSPVDTPIKIMNNPLLIYLLTNSTGNDGVYNNNTLPNQIGCYSRGR